MNRNILTKKSDLLLIFFIISFNSFVLNVNLKLIMNMKQLSKIIITLIILTPFVSGYSQNNWDFRTKWGDNWTNVSSWEMYNGTQWINANRYPTENDGVITITGWTVVNDNITADQIVITSNGALEIKGGKTLTVNHNASSTYDIQCEGNLQVKGNFVMGQNSKVIISKTSWITGVFTMNQGSILTLPSEFSIEGGKMNVNNATINSTYIFNLWKSSIFNANSGSTINFNDLTIGDNSEFISETNINVSGAFKYYSSKDFSITGDFINNGGFTYYGANSSEFNIYGSFTNNANFVCGNLTIINGIFTNNSYVKFDSKNVEIYGEYYNRNKTEVISGKNFYVKQGGLLDLTDGTNFYNGCTMNVYGTLNFGNSYMDGWGPFKTYDGAILKIGSPDGIQHNNTTGNLRTDIWSRTFGKGTTFEYNGITSQITGNELPDTIDKFIMSNPTTLTLTNNLSVKDEITLNSGKIITNGKTLILGRDQNNSGTLFYNGGYVVGQLSRWVKKGQRATMIYPIATLTQSRMVVINFSTEPTVGGTLLVEFINTDPGINGGPYFDNGYEINRYAAEGYWSISQSGITGGTYSINLTAEGFNGVQNPSELRIMQKLSGQPEFTFTGYHIDGSGSIENPTAKRGDLSSFGLYAIAGNSSRNPLNGALPVELISFTSSVKGNEVTLYWSTAWEINNSGFEVYRKPAGQTEWTKLGFVKGNNNTQSQSNYLFKDKVNGNGKLSYKLKQIDYNGNYEYFILDRDIDLSNPTKFSISQNYPNPFNPVTKIDYRIPSNMDVTISVFDMTGKLVKNIVNNEMKTAGFYTVEFNGSEFSSGTYIYKITAKGNGQEFSESKKMILVK